LQALLDRVLAEEGLGTFQEKLQTKLELLIQRGNEGIEACREPKQGRAETRLKQIVKGLGGYRHKLSSRKARKKLDPVVRETFVDAGEPIRADAQALRETLVCPDDAPAL
jgi:hypothetical protein